MSIFDSLFGKHDAAAPAQPQSAGASHMAHRTLYYDPDLIPRLTQEHHALERLFGEIKQSHSARDFAALGRALQKFQLTLNLHLATEQAEFYGYLHRNLKQGSAEYSAVSNSWAEMQQLGNAVAEFLARHNSSEINAETHGAFGAQFELLGAALMKRIKHEEEKLYGLYAPA